MERFQWNPVKNERLKKVRGVGFEELIQSKLVDIKAHPAREEQEIMFFEFKGSIWLIPCVRSEGAFFLKTLYQSRKYTKLYKRGEL